MTDNELSKCIDSLLEDSTSDLGDLSLSVHLSNLSIDNSPNPSDNDQSSSFNLPSNLSKNLSNLSISYSISFEESPSPKPYSINTKRKRPSRLSVDSPQTGYSPLATSLLTSSNKKCPDKRRMSEFFKSEISVLNFSNKLGSIDSLSDKDISFRDLSVDSNKENLSDLSIDLNPNLSTKTTKSARFSERFRNEVSQLNLSSPDISFDLHGSGSPSPNVSLSFSDDEDGLNTCNKSGKGNVLESSSDEDELSFDKENFKNMRLSRSLSEEDPGEQDEDDQQYDSSFIDDEAIEGSEESVSEEEEEEAEEEASLLDLSDDDEYVTPPSRNTETETPFYTPRSTKRNYAIFKTPSEFCHTPPVPTPSDRRKTCLATPLSVRTKTGTPGAPNRTYSRNVLTAARELFDQFNESVFGNQLPKDMEIKLNKRLNTTAGRCVYLRKGALYKAAYIELSPKVVDCLERLKETLAHELCHAATFIIDNVMDNHGPVWKRWAKRVNTKYPELPPVSRCHTYQIKYKYNYSCSEGWCRYTIGRHSKSINLDSARCPLCFSRLMLPDNGKTPSKTPNKWTAFVKSRFNDVKADQPPRTPHKDLMKILSKEFQDMKVKGTS